MKIFLDLTSDEIELLKSQLDNDDCGGREGWKSTSLERLIDKVDEATKPMIGVIVFDGRDGKIISNGTNVKKVIRIDTGHYKFE